MNLTRCFTLRNTIRKDPGTVEFTQEIGDLNINYIRPGWFDKSKVTKRFDAREMLEAGEMPVHQVMTDLKSLTEKDIYELTVPLLTVPLIEKATSLGFNHWFDKQKEDLFVIHFRQKSK